MIKYILASLLLLPIPAVAQQQSPNLETINNQFYWLLQIFLDSSCSKRIPVTTEKRTFTVDRNQLIDSLYLLDSEIKQINRTDLFPLNSVLQSSGKECK